MNNDEKISIIITTYKRPVNIVKRAILSALNQTYTNTEIIVVNDYPEDKKLSDNIGKMISNLNQNKIIYIIENKNNGACYARNLGIKKSHGKFIALLDDDDEWENSKLEKQIRGFSYSDKVGMVYSPYINVDNVTGKREKVVLGKKSGNIIDEILIKNCIGGCSMPLIKKEVFSTCGLFDEKFPALQDYDMWVRISQKYEVFFVDEPLTIRYLQDDSISNNFEKKQKGYELFINKHLELYQSKSKIYNHSLNRTVKAYFQRGKIKEGFDLYKVALKTKKISIYNLYYPLVGLVKFFAKKIRK